MPPSHHKPNIIILILLISYASVSAVLCTPALPFAMHALHTTSTVMQVSVAIFLLGYALGQLIYGPLAEHFGRIKSLKIGFITALIGEGLTIVACLIASVPLLLIARLVTAVGACGGYALTFAMIRDVYDLKESRKVFSMVILAFAVMPGIAIATGAFLTQHFGYLSCFYFLLGYGCFLVFSVNLLPETSPSFGTTGINLKQIMSNYLDILQNKTFLTHGICFGIWGAFLYIYYADAPFIATQDFKLSTQHYGLISLITSAGYFLGNVIARILASHTCANSVIRWGVMTIAAGIILLGIDTALASHPYLLYFIAIAVCFTGGAMMVSNLTALALADVKNVSYGSAMFGFLNGAGPMLSVMMASLAGNAHLMAFFLIYCTLFFLLCVVNHRTATI